MTRSYSPDSYLIGNFEGRSAFLLRWKPGQCEYSEELHQAWPHLNEITLQSIRGCKIEVMSLKAEQVSWMHETSESQAKFTNAEKRRMISGVNLPLFSIKAEKRRVHEMKEFNVRCNGLKGNFNWF